MASPIVAGVAGLVLAHPANQTLSYAGLKSRLIQTANPRLYSGDAPGNVVYYPRLRGDVVATPLLGAGIIDALAAITGKTSLAQSAEALNRVGTGCGTVGASGYSLRSLLSWWLILGPCFVVGLVLEWRKVRAKVWPVGRKNTLPVSTPDL